MFDSGWTKQGIAKLWFTVSFLPQIRPERPQILVSDGHDSHNFIEIIEIARANNVVILEVHTHKSYWLLLDKSCFGPLKTAYNAECDRMIEQFLKSVRCKDNSCVVFERALEKALSSENIVSGFRACGIHPYDPDAIPAKAYIPNVPFERVRPDEQPGILKEVSTPPAPKQPQFPFRNTSSPTDVDNGVLPYPQYSRRRLICPRIICPAAHFAENAWSRFSLSIQYKKLWLICPALRFICPPLVKDEVHFGRKTQSI